MLACDCGIQWARAASIDDILSPPYASAANTDFALTQRARSKP
jgi:hypothetical protein